MVADAPPRLEVLERRALLRRQTTGQGTHIDLSLLDCQAALLTYLAQYFWTDGRVPGPQGSGHASVVPYQALATRDGHLIVAVFAEKFWRGFCLALGRPEWERDPRFATNVLRVERRSELIPLIESFMPTRTGADWQQRLTQAGVPCAPVLDYAQLFGEAQGAARGWRVTVRDPKGQPVDLLGSPVHIDGLPPAPPRLPPALGQNTAEVLQTVLGLDAGEIQQLRSKGVV